MRWIILNRMATTDVIPVDGVPVLLLHDQVLEEHKEAAKRKRSDLRVKVNQLCGFSLTDGDGNRDLHCGRDLPRFAEKIVRLLITGPACRLSRKRIEPRNGVYRRSSIL